MSSAILPFPVVRRGARNHPVRTLQHLLRAHEQSVEVDGIFGAHTEAAIRALQASRGLAVDGVVGPQTWQALIVTVRRGSRGEAVRAVQEEFQFRNLSGDPSRGVQIDGIFGAQTEAAVRGLPGGRGADGGRNRRPADVACARQRDARRLTRDPRTVASATRAKRADIPTCGAPPTSRSDS